MGQEVTEVNTRELISGLNSNVGGERGCQRPASLLNFPYLENAIGYVGDSVVAILIRDGTQFALLEDSILVGVYEDLPVL